MEPTPHSSSNPQRRAILAEIAPPFLMPNQDRTRKIIQKEEARAFQWFSEDFRKIMEAKNQEWNLESDRGRNQCMEAWEKLPTIQKLAYDFGSAPSFVPADLARMSRNPPLWKFIAAVRRNRGISCLKENGENVQICVDTMNETEERVGDEAISQDEDNDDPSRFPVYQHPEFTRDDFAYYSGYGPTRTTIPDIPAYKSDDESSKDDDDDDDDPMSITGSIEQNEESQAVAEDSAPEEMEVDGDEGANSDAEENQQGGGDQGNAGGQGVAAANVAAQQLGNAEAHGNAGGQVVAVANVAAQQSGNAEAHGNAGGRRRKRAKRGSIPSYIFYSLEKRREMKGVQTIPHPEIGELWKNLDEEKKAKYKAMAEADKIKHRQEKATKKGKKGK